MSVKLVHVDRIGPDRTTMPGRETRERVDHSGERMTRFEASMLAAQIQRCLAPHVERACIAGSFRRGAADVGDLDYLIIPRTPRLVADLGSPPQDGGEWRRAIIAAGVHVLDEGPHRLLFATRDKRRVDIIATCTPSWGAALLYLTGSKWHNIALRSRARAMDMVLNEYGLWRSDGALIAAREEGDIYDALGLKWMPPGARRARPAPRWERAEPFMARRI